MNDNNTQRNVVGLLGLSAFVGAIWWLFSSTSKKTLDGVESNVLKEYKELTEQNDHTGAALVLAKRFGTKEDVEVLESIQKRHENKGRISQADQKLRSDISNRLYYKHIKKLDGINMSDVSVGDYLLLNTGDEQAKIKVTKIRDKYGRPEIDGEVKVNGKKKLVAVLDSDFKNGFVKKIKSGTKVKQKLKS